MKPFCWMANYHEYPKKLGSVWSCEDYEHIGHRLRSLKFEPLYTASQLEAAREEGRKEGMAAGFNDGLVMAKLALLEMDECEEMSHGGCSCSTIKPAIEKIDEIRAAGKEKKE